MDREHEHAATGNNGQKLKPHVSGSSGDRDAEYMQGTLDLVHGCARRRFRQFLAVVSGGRMLMFPCAVFVVVIPCRSASFHIRFLSHCHVINKSAR
jgi:hypothetical protein